MTELLSEGVESWFCILYICILLVVAFLALLFNSVVLATIYSSAELRRPFDLYMANLAVADIVLAFSSTFTIDNAKTRWSMGAGLCKACSYGMYLSYSASILTLAVMSIERYHGICKPTQRTAMKCFEKCRVTVPVLWLAAMFVSLPTVFAYGVQEISVAESADQLQQICVETWSPLSRQVHYVAFLFLLFVAPVILIFFTLARIIEKLNVPMTSLSGGNVILHKKRMRTAQMLLTMALLQVLCWVPSLFSKVVNSFSGQYPGSMNLWLGFELLHFGRSVVFPLIYVGMHPGFRSSLKTLHQACCVANDRKESNATRATSVPGSSAASDRSAFYYPEDEFSTDM